MPRYVRSRGQAELKSAIRLALPRPDEILPDNSAPAVPHFLVPRGRSIQVTGETDHLDVLGRYVKSRGQVVLVATLHPVEVTKARSTNTVLEARVDGERVGQLTPATSTSLMPIIEEARQHGRVAACWATLTGSRLAAEITLKVVKAEEMPHEWPRDADIIPPLTAGQAIAPPAYQEQVELPEPPSPAGLSAWQIAVAVVALLMISSITFVGIPLLLIGIIGLIILHKRLRTRPPNGRVRQSSFEQRLEWRYTP